MDRRNFIKNSSMLGLGIPLVSNSLDFRAAPIIKPKALPKKPTVQLVTPGSAITRSQFEKTVESMESLGFNLKFSDNIRVRSGFLAGTDEQRIQDMMDGFKDDAVDAIICGRGGYGTGRLLSQLDYQIIRANPKIFIGFSDITALLNSFYSQIGLVGFHGPVAASEFNDFTADCLLDIIQKGKSIKVRNDDSKPIYEGTATGKLTGGNLSILCSLIGTPYEVNLDGHILFLEEVGESSYRVDRMLTHLRNAGKLNNVKGIVLGYFTNCDLKEEDKNFEFSISLDEVFKDRFAGLNIPVAKGFPIGHEAHNATIPMGIMAELDADKGTLKMLESAVS
jgi:muramoyltetrapeptide carboxypeptidase